MTVSPWGPRKLGTESRRFAPARGGQGSGRAPPGLLAARLGKGPCVVPPVCTAHARGSRLTVNQGSCAPGTPSREAGHSGTTTPGPLIPCFRDWTPAVPGALRGVRRPVGEGGRGGRAAGSSGSPGPPETATLSPYRWPFPGLAVMAGGGRERRAEPVTWKVLVVLDHQACTVRTFCLFRWCFSSSF